MHVAGGVPGSFILLQFDHAAISDVIQVDATTGELFLEEVADVRRNKLVFEHLCAVAACPEASLALVTSSVRGGKGGGAAWASWA
jgi:hypothetical protein